MLQVPDLFFLKKLLLTHAAVGQSAVNNRQMKEGSDDENVKDWQSHGSHSHGSVRVVRTTSKVNGKC